MTKPTDNDYPINDILKERWSPLAFANTPVSAENLHSLFEAARWSPSSSNEQPWRFIVGTRDGDPETYAKLLDCLVPANQSWAHTAPVLMLGLAATKFARTGADNHFALYDTGQAVAHMTAEATSLGILMHQMGGFDREKARQVFAVPDNFVFAAAIALGYLGDPAVLADEKYRERHLNPVRVRRPLTETFLAGIEEGTEVPSPLL